MYFAVNIFFPTEPAILVMLNSLRIHPTVTASLLDFLCRVIINFSTLNNYKPNQYSMFNLINRHVL